MAKAKPAKSAPKAAAKTGGKKKKKAARRSWLRSCMTLFVGGGCTSVLATGVAIFVLSVLITAAIVLGYERYVVEDPGQQFDPDNIAAAIAADTPIVYNDGTTRVGVFFADEHREYIPYDQIPAEWVVAIVAAEDGRYWSHAGIDPWGMGRAMVSNLKSGSVVAGGSTLTQQTAKNLFKRPDRSLKSKGDEFLNALRLEEHFDKAQILEFYANQFHVSGNGRGLGIAARYFFDKEADDLDLLECAYIAGLVKGPTNYDPFLSSDPEKQEKARGRAQDRVRYVLGRIVDEDESALAGPWPETDADQAAFDARLLKVRDLKAKAADLLAADAQLNFQHGEFRYDKNAVVDEIARRLGEEPYKSALSGAGVDDPAVGGIKIVTTLDANVQREATYGLWHVLTETGTMLEGHTAVDFIREDEAPHPDPSKRLVRHEFSLASVVSHEGGNGEKYLKLDLGGPACVADRDAVTRAALWAYRGQQQNKNAKVSSTTVDAFAAAIPDGSVVFVSVRDLPADGPAACDLELRPTLQGATVVVEDGQIRAMVGGNDNRDFNRARAKRQMGSTWKPLVYHTAIGIGWSPADPLMNEFGVYTYQGVAYWPSSDHTPAPIVSMAWAGVNSDNLASVWLLYHLTDRLDDDHAQALAADVGLWQKPTESEADWHGRLSKLGIAPSGADRDEAIYLHARQEVLQSGSMQHPDDALPLQALLYGRGFEAERKVVQAEPKDRDAKLAVLDRSWMGLSGLVDDCEREYPALARAVKRKDAADPAQVAHLWVRAEGSTLDVACAAAPPEGFAFADQGVVESVRGRRADEPEEAVEAIPLEEDVLPEPVRGRDKKKGRDEPTPTPKKPAKPPPGRFGSDAPIWGGGDDSTDGVDGLAPLADVQMGGHLHLSTLLSVRDAVNRRQAIDGGADPWDRSILLWTQDFRVALGISAVVKNARAYGIQSDIYEGLPLPLGASEISIEEAATLYDGLTSGTAYSFPGSTPDGGVGTPRDPALLILRIEDLDGNVLYEAQPTAKEVEPPQVADMTVDILRNVVRYGTAKKGALWVQDGKAAVPLGGKTGTTNEYRNSAFLGYAPKWNGAAYSMEGGFAVGVYVGYDDNRKMDVGRIEIAGASAALPAWLITIEGMRDAGLLGHPEGRSATPVWPLAPITSDLQRIAVAGDLATGGEGSDNAPSILTTPFNPPVLPVLAGPEHH